MRKSSAAVRLQLGRRANNPFAGFTDVRILSDSSEFNGVQLIKTKGRHDTDAARENIGKLRGEVCGVVFKRSEEKTAYLAADTIWNDDVASVLATHKPDVAILNAGDARVVGIDDGIIMNTADVLSSIGPRPMPCSWPRIWKRWIIAR